MAGPDEAKMMSLRRRDALFVMAHGRETPRQPEWDELLRQIGEVEPVSDTKALVYSLGGAPSTTQRGELNDLTGEQSPRIAVLSESRVVRSVGVAVSWFQRGFKAFRPSELDLALDHLGIEGAVRDWAARALAEACRDLGVVPPVGLIDPDVGTA